MSRNCFPISPKKYKRVYLNVIQKDLDPENAFVQSWKEKFEQEGFQVTVRDRRVSISMEDFVNPAGMTPEKGKLMHEMYLKCGGDEAGLRLVCLYL